MSQQIPEIKTFETKVKKGDDNRLDFEELQVTKEEVDEAVDKYRPKLLKKILEKNH